MSTSPTTIDFILDQSREAGRVAARQMFGEYALYCNDRVVGLVCHDQLYIKITEPGQQWVGRYYEEGHAYPGAKVSMLIDGDRIADSDWLSELLRITAANVPLPKPKKRKKL